MTYLFLGILLLLVGLILNYVQGVPMWVGSLVRIASYVALAYGAYLYFVSSLGPGRSNGAVANFFTGKVTRA